MGYHPPSYYNHIPEGKRVEGFFLVNKPTTKASGRDVQAQGGEMMSKTIKESFDESGVKCGQGKTAEELLAFRSRFGSVDSKWWREMFKNGFNRKEQADG